MKNVIQIVLVLILSNLPKIGSSQIDTIPVFKDLQLALKNPDEVIKLDLSKQKLSELPAEVYQFKNLRELYLGKNKFEAIPSDINKLNKLEIIDFSKNKLTALPLELFECKKLKKIIVNQNEISSIPKEIGNLKELEYLDMWSNDVGTVPEEIKWCERLKEIDFRVIEMTKVEQDRIKAIIPKVSVHFSPYCTCSR
jgi:Leucine-rich repeat (LRR) protein